MSPANKLSKEMIINTAFDYVNQYGLEKLSMRKLSKKLHVRAMSLYNHVDNKDDLIVELVDKLVGYIQFDIADTWQETMKQRARMMKHVLMEHPWATKPLVSGWNIKENYLTFFDRSLGSLLEAGFSYKNSDQILLTINAYVYGYVLRMVNFPIQEDDYQSSAEEHKNFFDQNIYPHLWGLSESIRLGTYSGKADFDLGLDIVLNGIEQTIEKGEEK